MCGCAIWTYPVALTKLQPCPGSWSVPAPRFSNAQALKHLELQKAAQCEFTIFYRDPCNHYLLNHPSYGWTSSKKTFGAMVWPQMFRLCPATGGFTTPSPWIWNTLSLSICLHLARQPLSWTSSSSSSPDHSHLLRHHSCLSKSWVPSCLPRNSWIKQPLTMCATEWLKTDQPKNLTRLMNASSSAVHFWVPKTHQGWVVLAPLFYLEFLDDL